MNAVYEIRVVERVERTYLVNVEVNGNQDEEDRRALAEEKLHAGEFFKMLDHDADIEEVLSVERQEES
jgi:hypothetical protein